MEAREDLRGNSKRGGDGLGGGGGSGSSDGSVERASDIAADVCAAPDTEQAAKVRVNTYVVQRTSPTRKRFVQHLSTSSAIS